MRRETLGHGASPAAGSEFSEQKRCCQASERLLPYHLSLWLHISSMTLLDPKICGCALRSPCAVPGCSLTGPGSFWLVLVALGCSWLLLAAPGWFWLVLAAPGCQAGPAAAIISTTVGGIELSSMPCDAPAEDSSAEVSLNCK